MPQRHTVARCSSRRDDMPHVTLYFLADLCSPKCRAVDGSRMSRRGATIPGVGSRRSKRPPSSVSAWCAPLALHHSAQCQCHIRPHTIRHVDFAPHSLCSRRRSRPHDRRVGFHAQGPQPDVSPACCRLHAVSVNSLAHPTPLDPLQIHRLPAQTGPHELASDIGMLLPHVVCHVSRAGPPTGE